MCDCFPNGGSIPVPEQCQQKTGASEYANNFKVWCNSGDLTAKSFSPNPGKGDDVWKQRYSFSKGPRFGVPPYCDCTPPVERFRFETTYTRDYNDCVHMDPATRRHRVVDGAQPQFGQFVPKQHLCPFTTETTYSRTFDMPQAHFQQICGQQDPCGECAAQPCDNNVCQNPCGLEIRYSTKKIKPPVPKLLKENLIKPGTDTSCCEACPKPIPCCPCPEDEKTCGACCACEFPCKTHQAATIPMRKYPIVWNTPRYVPNPRDPPRRPKLLCAGGTCECPVQNQFPTQQAIKMAKYKLMEKLEKERCRYPPECIESVMRASYKVPPFKLIPKYASIEHQLKARKAHQMYEEQGFPQKCTPYYCLDGGRPADTRPPFDHMSITQTDFIWNVSQRFKHMGGESPCKFETRPLCPGLKCASDLIKERTEEKERWGEDWECVPPPADEQ